MILQSGLGLGAVEGDADLLSRAALLALAGGQERVAAHLTHAVLALHALDLLVLSPAGSQGHANHEGGGADDPDGAGAVVPRVLDGADAKVDLVADPAAGGRGHDVLEGV